MTDDQVIKGWKCCVGGLSCEGCPYVGEEHCGNVLFNDTDALLQRQRAEIDRLTEQLKTARADAVREFAESLKRKSELVAPSVWAIPYRAVAVADIDRLLEGMGCNDD